tara:strand:+ start:499 stop:879 length:381 start_codon:yes stop_codon:yes gene_type:complete
MGDLKDKINNILMRASDCSNSVTSQALYDLCKSIQKGSEKDKIWSECNIESMNVDFYKGKKMLFSDTGTGWAEETFIEFDASFSYVMRTKHTGYRFCRPLPGKVMTKADAEKLLSEHLSEQVKITM